jgi:hypothetical protein
MLPIMRLGKRLALCGFSFAMAAWLTGCSGVNSSYGVSPATFLMPGLLRIEPPRPPPASSTNLLEVAQLDSFRN